MMNLALMTRLLYRSGCVRRTDKVPVGRGRSEGCQVWPRGARPDLGLPDIKGSHIAAPVRDELGPGSRRHCGHLDAEVSSSHLPDTNAIPSFFTSQCNARTTSVEESTKGQGLSQTLSLFLVC
jgi:hypothetical protein